jgi:predicted RNA-binding Zn ribbon-like protein
MAIDRRFGPTRRGGPVFRWLGEPLAIDLANTVMVVRPEAGGGADGEIDLLASAADLRRWLSAEGGRVAAFAVDAEKDLGAIHELRDAVRALLAATAKGRRLPRWAVAHVNEASAASPVAPQLAAGPGRPSIASNPQDESVAGMLGAVARSAIELLDETPAGELRVCLAPSCGMFYLGKRRWCCSACGNRARAARHYRRSKAAQ